MRIEARDDGIYYVAQPGGRPPVDFKLASESASELVFVNPGHADHLKKVIYRRESDGNLTARIEGENGGKEFSRGLPVPAAVEQRGQPLRRGEVGRQLAFGRAQACRAYRPANVA